MDNAVLLGLTYPIVSTSACLQAGEILAGKFCVERIIATGGVGVVVAARHLQLGETVAIKLLIPQPDRDATDVARFVREAQSAVKLKNEHVARVLDVGTLDDGAPFIVMEYLEGSDLDQMLRHRGPMSIRDAVDYVLQACEAIAEAHQLGIVHRDLKPANFFLTKRTDGSPLIKVLDFGIAKPRADLQQDVSLTKTRTVLGSPVYMSPEQIRSARSVDHRTDIWSLGVTLYELLTDQLPFDGDSITGVAAAVSTDPIAPLRSIRPEVPIGLSTIVEKCLEKKATDRYQTVAEFAAALAPYGPDSVHYSLTRIRGASGLKTLDSGSRTLSGEGTDSPRTLSGEGTDSPIAAGSAPTINRSSSETIPATSAPKKQRHLLVGALLLLVVGALLIHLSRQRHTATHLSTTAVQSPLAAKDHVVPVASILVPAPRDDIAPAHEPGLQVVPGNTGIPSVSTTLAISNKVQETPVASSARRKIAPAPPASSHVGTAKSSATKESSSPTRYEAIFDTRK